MMKRIFCLILCFALCFAALPLSANAAEEISYPELDGFIKPFVGMTAGEAQFETTVPVGAHYYIVSGRWHNYTDDHYMADDEVFEADKRYAYNWRIAAESGYVFTGNYFELNGSDYFVDYSKISVYDTARTQLISDALLDGWSKTFLPLEDDDVITAANISITRLPEDGEALLTYVYNNRDFVTDDSPCACNTDIYLADGTHTDALHEFKAGESIYYVFTMAHRLGHHYGSELPTVLLDGSTDMIRSAELIINASGERYMTVTTKLFTIPDTDPTHLAEVRVNGVTAPVIGQTATDNIKSLSVPDGANYKLNGGVWYNAETGQILYSGDTFEEGVNYQLKVSVIAKKGYSFVAKPAVYINGATALLDADSVERFSDTSIDIGTVNMYAEEAPLTPITDVELSGFSIPSVGQEAGDNLISVTVPDGAPYEIYEADWEYTYGETVLPDEAFEADGSYYAVFVIRAAEGYAFDSAATNATINGDTALIDMSYTTVCSETEMVVYTVDLTPSVPQEIADIIIEGYADPEVGQSAALNTASITIPSDAPYHLFFAAWFKKSDYSFVNSVFSADTEYYLFFKFEPSDGYAFGEEVPAVYIDGSTDQIDSAFFNQDGELWVTTKAVTAEQSDVTLITEIQLTGYTAPVVGQKAGDNRKTITAADDAPYQKRYDKLANWRDLETGNFLSDSDVFEAGKQYVITFPLESKENYLFADSSGIVVTLNGSPELIDRAESNYSDHNKYITVYTVPITPVESSEPPESAQVITSLEITIPEPVAGEHPSYSATVPDGKGYALEDFDLGKWLDGILWQDESYDIDDTVVFQSGMDYTVNISVVLTDEMMYQFAAEDKLTAAVNGKKAHFYPSGDNNYVIVYTFYMRDPAKMIDTVSVTIPEPAAGELMSYSASVPDGAPYSVENFNGGHWLNGVLWTDSDNMDIVPGAVFEAGEEYTVWISLVLPDDDDSWFPDGDMVTVTLNGKTAVENKYNSKNFGLYYTFTVPDAPSAILGDADGNGVVNVFDAAHVQKGLTGTKGYPAYGSMDKSDTTYRVADADGDGTVNIFDASLIQKYLTGTASAQSYGIGAPLKAPK